jgi:6-pyruvoyltetrahydropterin/6-carboxytetrahydropterin synthase
MYEITTEASFSAAHYLKDYNGPCENLHGHNWLVKATVRCETLNSIGIGIDFKELRGLLREVLEELDHKDLNVVLAARSLNPSSENIACYVFGTMKQRLPASACSMYRVEVFETPGNSTAYME